MVSDSDISGSENVEDVADESADVAAVPSDERFRRKKAMLEIAEGNTPFNPLDVTNCRVSQRTGRRNLLSSPLESATPVCKNLCIDDSGPGRPGSESIVPQ